MLKIAGNQARITNDVAATVNFTDPSLFFLFFFFHTCFLNASVTHKNTLKTRKRQEYCVGHVLRRGNY